METMLLPSYRDPDGISFFPNTQFDRQKLGTGRHDRSLSQHSKESVLDDRSVRIDQIQIVLVVDLYHLSPPVHVVFAVGAAVHAKLEPERFGDLLLLLLVRHVLDFWRGCDLFDPSCGRSVVYG
mmetsp:Transcript_29889/g.68579  ORF Transcript_29889/g.68579 Transcript_29889/m.68579 type:complete len:124 (+) Transcript_29889:1015-1386(+)